MAAVVIGVGSAKRSNTIEVIDAEENVLLMARFENSSADYCKMRALVKQWPTRKWAVEGATGVGLGLAQRLVSDGEPLPLTVRSQASAEHALNEGAPARLQSGQAHRLRQNLPNPQGASG